MASFRDELCRLEVETFNGKRFVPQSSLEQALTGPRIKEILSSPQFKKDFFKQGELTQLILEGGRKLFGSLILIEREDAILKFLEMDRQQGFDSQLPLKLDDSRVILGNEADAEEFCKVQWKFLAPILRKDRSHRAFEETETILPFIKSETLPRGGFGYISKVTLSPLHQQLVNLDLDGNAVVIRKEIASEKHTGSENEEERILASLRVMKHRNIITLLTSFSYGRVHNLIFPLADGDLEAFLRGKMQRAPHFRHDHAIFREIHGISSAIETVHTFLVGEFDLKMMGCHYDLKPKNILVKDGKFLLTDFGLSRLELPDTGPQETQVRVQGFYYAPECQSSLEEFKKPIVGREADVWSFGCILAMMATFIQYGPPGIEEFERSRKTSTDIPGHAIYITRSFHLNGQPNPAVQSWLARTQRDSQSTCLRGTLGLVRNLLQVNPEARPTMTMVTKELLILAQRAVFEFSCDKFRHLLSQTDSAPLNIQCSESGHIELEMECKRYNIWGTTSGLTEEHCDQSQPEVVTELLESHSGIINILTEIEDELQFIESWKTRSLRPTYYRLKKLNDKLWAYHSPQLADEMHRALESAMLDGKSLKDLQNISSTFRSHASSGYNDIGELAKIKHIMTGTFTNPDERDDLLLQSSDISLGPQFDNHNLGTIKRPEGVEREPALVEWIIYGPHWEEKLYARVHKIARLFCNSNKVERSGLRVLWCNGYYRDESKKRFGLIYKIPRLDPKPITLRQLIKETNSRSHRPVLGDLFELARKIALCVLEVHKVGWVHRSISAYNIIFFPPTESRTISVESPYLIGFNHSRGDDRQTFTEGVGEDVKRRQYHHPDYIRNDHGFRPQHDYYSVGLVLLEIGRWRTVSQLTMGMENFSLEKRGDALIRECVQNLGNSMGTHYRDAVKTCLTSDFTAGCSGDEIRNEFETKVVNYLAKCFA